MGILTIHSGTTAMLITTIQAAVSVPTRGRSFFQLSQNLISSINQGCRHARHFRHMNTKAMGTTASGQLTQENDFIAHFLIGYMKILYTG
jgi:hypothetical protein